MNSTIPSKKRSSDADAPVIKSHKKVKIAKILERLELVFTKETVRYLNLPGLLNLPHGFDSAGDPVTSYCRVKDALELQSFLLEGMLAMEVLDVWVNARENRFGISDKASAFQLQRKTLLDLLMNETLMTKEVLSLKLPLHNSEPFKGVNRALFSWIVTMWQLIDGAPRHFPDTATDFAKAMGASPEDWHRAYFLLLALWKYKNKRRITSADRANQSNEAVEPQLLTLEDMNASSAATGSVRHAETLNRLHAFANTVYEPEKGLSMKDMDAFSTLVENSFESQLVTEQNKIDLIRPALSLQDQKEALRSCYQGLQVLYPISEDQLLMRGGYSKPASFLQLTSSLIQSALLLENARSPNNDVLMRYELIRVETAIPPYQILTVELALSKNQQKLYDAIHEEHSPRLNAAEIDGEGNEEMRMNMVVHRRLTHATFNTQLVKFDERTKDGLDTMSTMYDSFGDRGASFYHHRTRSDDISPPYTDRLTMSWYVCAQSPKLQAIARIVHHVCYEENHKIIIFGHWPRTLWNIEMFLALIGVKTCSIKSSMTLTEKNAVIAEFNDTTSELRVLVTPDRITVPSLSLKEDCFNMLFADIPEEENTLKQCIRSIHGWGQRQVQKVWILTVDHTYDQVIQARAASKYLGQLAGSLQFKLTLEEIEQAKKYLKDYGDTDRDAESYALDLKCQTLYMQLYGQRSSRHEWLNIDDLYAKDRLPTEIAFRRSWNAQRFLLNRQMMKVYT